MTFRNSVSLWTVLALLACVSTVFGWEPVKGPLQTRWTKDVSAESPWPEYPRPQLVRPDWQNLNGLWQYAIAPKAQDKPTDWDGEILVPYPVESQLSGVMKPLKPEDKLWYQRTFDAPKLPKDGRLLLHFGAVDWQTTVWVNGKEVGQHTGGYDPFTFDITDALKEGENKLLIAVWDPTDTGWQPHGKQVLNPQGIMYTAVSGIWQTVWLETVPASYIESLKIVPDIDRKIVKIQVNTSAPGSVNLTAKTDGKTIATAQGSSGKMIELKIPDPKLWSPDSPHLYDLEVSLLKNGKPTDSVNSYFGMRKIEVRKDKEGINRLFLNNEVLFQYGPLDQGWWPDGLYTPATEAAMKYDIEMTKEFGMNMARKHVKYESARWYQWCDKLGLLVWQDMPAGDTGKNEESKANFLKELKAMIDTLHNYPSIVMWVPFNESWGQHDTPEVVKWIEKYDPTRPVNEASGWNDQKSGSVSDMHSYPGPGMRPVEDNRVSVLGEFGGLGMPIEGHTWQQDKNWGYVSFKNKDELTEAYVGLLTAMRPLIGKGLSAAVYTQTSDVEIEVNGLMTYDRDIVKMDLERIAQAAHKLHSTPPTQKTILPTSREKPRIWKYTTKKPKNAWFKPTFSDASWESGVGGFGNNNERGVEVGTKWNTSDIWLRSNFTLDSVPTKGDLYLYIHHDEDAEIYLNGQLLNSVPGNNSNYVIASLPSDAIKMLQTGKNTLAVHCHQTEGGQFIDLGLILLLEKEE